MLTGWLDQTRPERASVRAVVQRGSRLMNLRLDGQAGAILRRGVEDLGIHVHLDTRTNQVDIGEDGRVTGLQFGDGSERECDMVVVTTGIRPNVELAARAGLTVECAIVVDDTMRALDEQGIYVVGECAQHRGQVYGLVAPPRRRTQAQLRRGRDALRTAARVLLA